MKKRALFSVSDKTGIVDFARKIAALGYEIVSTGGTEKVLTAGDVPVRNISEITGFPECLDGRVKTLHPIVHAGIMAIRDNHDHMAQLELLGIETIDIVVINLYPFKQTILKPGVKLEEAIENIDVGGPTMIRAAAKNWQDVIVAVDPQDYEGIIFDLENDGVSREKKFKLALKVFEHTAHYDALIADYLRREAGGGYPEYLTLTFEKQQDLRYGENPHQNAVFYKDPRSAEGSIAAAQQLHGKELSFNNINDCSAALGIIKEFENPCAVAVKHTNPCGVGLGSDIYEAYIKAYEADKVSIFGGIIALNRPCDHQTAVEINKIFVEIVIAPGFTDEALEILKQKKNIRLLKTDYSAEGLPEYDFKKVDAGLLLQSADNKLFDGEPRLVTTRQANERELEDLETAWKVCKHVRSNAIVLAKNGAAIGIGPGQTNRITALELACKYAGDRAAGSVLASDAFFPFPDCVELAAAAGITAIYQPGGSIGDNNSIEACNRLGVAMYFTGIRHFKH